MAPSSGDRRTSALKTYSKRVKHHAEEPPSKKRRVEEPLPVSSSPRVRKSKGGTIRSYFKPLQRSSSPSATRPPHLSSDPFEHTSSTTSHSTQLLSDPLEHTSSTSTSQLSSDSLEPTSSTTKRSSQLWSDPLEASSTPPSSPPPRSEPSIEQPRRSQKRPKRRLTTRPILKPIINMSAQRASDHGSGDGTKSSDQPSPAASPIIGSAGPVKIEGQDELGTDLASRIIVISNAAVPNTQNLHQSQLDMGVPSMKICKECGMHYNTTLEGDRKNHDKHHKAMFQVKQLQIVPIGVNLMVDYISDACHIVREIDYRVPDMHKDRAYKALQLASNDLGGVIPTPEELWSLIVNPQNKNDRHRVPRFRLYLYLIDFDPVGLLLAERVSGEGDYYHGVMPFWHDWEHVKRSDEGGKKALYMCIERVWVRKDMRRKRIATRLVSKARGSFVPGLHLSRKEFAFSRPTEVGREFADAYCRKHA